MSISTNKFLLDKDIKYESRNKGNLNLDLEASSQHEFSPESEPSTQEKQNILTIKQVQKILYDLGFENNEVASWDESIEIPFGVPSNLFVAHAAIIRGYTFHNIDLYPELRSAYVFGRGEIPKFVTKKIQSVNPERFLNGKVHKAFSKSIFVWKHEMPKSNQQKTKIIDQFSDKFTKKYLYRGIASYGGINTALASGFSRFGYSRTMNEFGPGLYTTPNIEYAIKYAGRYGVLMIFDLTNPKEDLTTKNLSDVDEWKATVKGWICIEHGNKPPPPPQHDVDIIQGWILSNYDQVDKCKDPIPSEEIQVVVVSELGCHAFAEKLIGIIYLY